MPDYFSDEIPLEQAAATRCGQVLDHWRALKGEKFAPSWQQVELAALPPQLIPYVRIVDVVDDGAAFRYRFWGTGLADILGVELTSEEMVQPSLWPKGTGLDECLKVVSSGVPLGFIRRVTASEADRPFRPLEVSGLRLPLSSDGRLVDHILSICDFGPDRDAWKLFFEGFPLLENAAK